MPRGGEGMTSSLIPLTQIYVIKSPQLALVQMKKLLGVTLTNTLCWDTHIENVLKTLNLYLFMLSRNKMFVNIQKRKLFFNSYILTHLDYCCIIWGNYSDCSKDKRIKLKKRAANVILNKTLETPSAELFTKLQ